MARWGEQLIDVAGRNALLHYKDLRAGTLSLDGADETARAAVATGRTVPLARLFPDPAAHAHADAVRGKSQTIANLITSLVALGQRVLFVAEKRAAITAVTDRLARSGGRPD